MSSSLSLRIVFDLLLPKFKCIGNVFEEDQAQDCVFVDGSVQIDMLFFGYSSKFLVQVAEEFRIVGHE